MLLVAAPFCLTTGYLVFADTPAIDEKLPETKTILKVTQEVAQAFNQGDAKAIASHWSPNGVYLSHQTGERLQGRSVIEKDYAAHLRKIKGSQLALTIDAVRLITPDVASVDGSAHRRGHVGQRADRQQFQHGAREKEGSLAHRQRSRGRSADDGSK